MEEMLEYYDENLKKIGIKSRKAVHQEGLLHAVCHLWITDIKHQRIYYQLRSLDKDSFPGYYDITSAGHIDPKETPGQSMIREAKEEIGLTLSKDDVEFLGTIIEHMENDHEIVYVYAADIENPVFNPGPEVIDMFYVSLEDFMSDSPDCIFTDRHQKQFRVSKKQICPHDVHLIREYIYRQIH